MEEATLTATVIVFDVNETLLDLGPLDPHFEKMFGDPAVRRRWFELVLRNALVLTVLGAPNDFVTVAGASLQMVAEAEGVELAEEDRFHLAGSLRSLPPHADAVGALELLSNRGITVAALTNSPEQVAEDQLATAGLSSYFARILSVAPTGRFKPHREVYQAAATALDAQPAELALVAAHDWDVAGAMAAGWRGALVQRPGVVVNPLFPTPDVTGPDLVSVATQLLDGNGNR